MAMVCNTFNLEKEMQDLGNAVKKATKFFEKDRRWLSRRRELIAQRDAEMLNRVVIPLGKSIADEVQECLDWNRENADSLTKQFNSIPMP